MSTCFMSKWRQLSDGDFIADELPTLGFLRDIFAFAFTIGGRDRLVLNTFWRLYFGDVDASTDYCVPAFLLRS